MKKILISLLLTIFFVGCEHKPDLSIYFEDTKGCFVYYNSQSDSYQKYNEKRCAERFTPCSTFKIPNSLIALEEGIFSDPDSICTWDSLSIPKQNYWPESWAKDQSLRTGLQNSVVWFYQKIAEKIGKEKYQEHLSKINYGNQDISGPLNQFWLGNSLKISADEQINFLRSFYNNKLGYSEKNTSVVKEIMILEDTGVYTLYGKTGGGRLPNGNFIGWLVGFVENDKGISFYALNIEEKTFNEVANKRIKLAKKLLKAVEALPRAYD